MANIQISGSIEVQDSTGQNHIINADDFNTDEHLDGSTNSYDFDTGSWSVKRTVENINGMISSDDWQTDNCNIIHDNISFS